MRRTTVREIQRLEFANGTRRLKGTRTNLRTINRSALVTNQQTLSVVLSVHNAEKTLPQQVDRLLDVLPDLARHFEILILDDGSTDQTEEVAHELAMSYPQLRVAHHQDRRGPNASLKTAMEMTTGDVVVLQEHEDTEGLRSAVERFEAGRRKADPRWGASGDNQPSNPRSANRRRIGDRIIAHRADFGSENPLRPFASRQLFRV